MPTKLCQIIAVANGKKSRAQKVLTQTRDKVRKEQLTNGINRQYRPRDEEGEQLPPESKRVHYRVTDAIEEVTSALTEMFDVVATQDHGNTLAVADVTVEGKTILSKVPVTTLLFLEKQLTDLGTYIEKLPTLDPSEEWAYSNTADCYATTTHQTNRTKKVPRNHVLAEATKEHPAQVQVYQEDQVVGTWDTVKFSGAIPEKTKHETLERQRKLLYAVKMAREEANSMEVKDVTIGKPVFDFLFADIKDTSASSS